MGDGVNCGKRCFPPIFPLFHVKVKPAGGNNEKFFNKAVVVTGDGDFACLVNFLKDRNRLEVVLSPNSKKASILLKKAVPENIVFLERLRSRLEYVKDDKNNQK